MIIKDLSNEELMKELNSIYDYFWEFKVCARSKVKLAKLETIKKKC
ncbi:hypothetical protein [Clostridium tagluense]|uniref:Uncharacterized protein n=1 Tax=Clostridium tagluense TaxID=360422 RepID=A0A401UQF0_9CLOT|nr:hypothetical protein [Clostridium tagluense]GCD11757.1 hypothetical protein Ctaglu_33800 [Clostridium tagluense]